MVLTAKLDFAGCSLSTYLLMMLSRQYWTMNSSRVNFFVAGLDNKIPLLAWKLAADSFQLYQPVNCQLALFLENVNFPSAQQ